MTTELRRSILATLAYHDILDYPLTSWEVFQYRLLGTERDPSASNSTYAYEEVLAELRELESQKAIGQKNGFYFLYGRQELYDTRIWRTKAAEEKLRRVYWVLKLFPLVPFVRGVFLSGSVAMENARQASDVDILTVAKHGRIWSVRFFLSLLAFFCGALRSSRISRHTSGKLCLNHFITDKALPLKAKGLYNAATYIHLAPLYAPELLGRFYEANPWIFGFFPNASARATEYRKTVASLQKRSLQKSLEHLMTGRAGDLIESALKLLQRSFIGTNRLNREISGRVFVTDTELAFHPKSPEGSILDKYRVKMLEL